MLARVTRSIFLGGTGLRCTGLEVSSLWLWAALVLWTSLPVTGANAQGAADTSEAQAAPGPSSEPVDGAPAGIEEITVTARKREESLQATPISMIAFDEEELEGRQIVRITDIGEAVANLKLDTGNGSNNQTRIYIRGVGQDDFRDNVDPGVGLYVDGVYLPRLTGSVVSTLDVEGIEVLRGPQGTLFGKNTVGGVVSIRTRKPQPEFGGSALLRAGSLGQLDTQATLNVPLIAERAFSRLTFETQTDDGYTRNRTKDSRSGDNKLLKARLALRLLPRDDMTLDLSYEQTKEDEQVPTPECRLGNPFASGRFLSDNLAAGPSSESFVDACVGDRADDSPRTAGADFDQQDDVDTSFATATFSWDLSERVTFRSVSSWRRVDVRTKRADLDATAADAFGIGTLRNQDDALSQELQITGRALDDRLDYTVGAYAFLEKGHSLTRLSALSNLLDAIRAGTTGSFVLRDSVFTFDLLDVDGGLTDAVLGLNGAGTTRFDTRSYAGFAEATYDLTSKLSLTAGARFTTERKERQGKTVPLPDAAQFASRADRAQPTLGVPVSSRFGRWTPRVQLEYQATDRLFGYASYSRGFKSGGFNRSVVSALDRRSGGLRSSPEDPGEFDEEVLDSYEVGLKTQWLDNRLVVNLAGFYNKYRDIQLTTVQIDEDGVPVAQINNVAKAAIYGLELDLIFRPLAQLTVTGGLGLTRSEYRDFTARIDTGTELLRSGRINPETCRDLTPANCDPVSFLNATGFVFAPMNLPMADFSDEDRTNTPNFNANVSVNYILDLGGWGTAAARATYFVQGDVEYATFNDDQVRQSTYGLLNGRIAWELPDGATTISVSGRNLLNRSYVTGGFSLDDTNGVKTAYRSRPRTWSIEVSRRF